jgi:hypothetical protein
MMGELSDIEARLMMGELRDLEARYDGRAPPCQWQKFPLRSENV